MNFELTESQRMVRQLARDFAAKEIAPHVLEREHDEAWTFGVLRKMGELGLVGGLIPEEYGGSGLDAVSFALICEVIGGVSASVFTALTVQSILAPVTILNAGSEEQKRAFLPKLCSVEMIGAYALTEPNAGSDPSAMETMGRRDGDGWRLNGAKMWISNGSFADITVERSQGGYDVRIDAG